MTQQTTADEARIERLAALNDRLIAENARLRRIEEAAERVCGNDMAGIVEDGAWADLSAALAMQDRTAAALPAWLLAGLRAIEPGGVWCAYAPPEVGRSARRLVEMGLVTLKVQHGDWFVRRTARGEAIANGA